MAVRLLQTIDRTVKIGAGNGFSRGEPSAFSARHAEHPAGTERKKKTPKRNIASDTRTENASNKIYHNNTFELNRNSSGPLAGPMRAGRGGSGRWSQAECRGRCWFVCESGRVHTVKTSIDRFGPRPVVSPYMCADTCVLVLCNTHTASTRTGLPVHNSILFTSATAALVGLGTPRADGGPGGVGCGHRRQAAVPIAASATAA